MSESFASTAPSLLKRVRYELLQWFGIVGGALSLFSSLDGILELADWARWLKDQWVALTKAFWDGLFRIVAIDFPDRYLLFATTLLLVTSTAVAALMLGKERAPIYLQRAGTFKAILLGLMIFGALLFPLLALAVAVDFGETPIALSLRSLVLTTICMSAICFGIYRESTPLRRNLALALVSGLLLSLMMELLNAGVGTRFGSIPGSGPFSEVFLAYGLLFSVPYLVAPVGALVQRLLYIFSFLILFAGLDALSNLALGTRPPLAG